MLIASQDLLRYVTEQLVRYMENPKKLRKEVKAAKEPWQLRWFGQIPTSLYLIRVKKQKEPIIDEQEPEEG